MEGGESCASCTPTATAAACQKVCSTGALEFGAVWAAHSAFATSARNLASRARAPFAPRLISTGSNSERICAKCNSQRRRQLATSVVPRTSIESAQLAHCAAALQANKGARERGAPCSRSVGSLARERTKLGATFSPSRRLMIIKKPARDNRICFALHWAKFGEKLDLSVAQTQLALQFVRVARVDQSATSSRDSGQIESDRRAKWRQEPPMGRQAPISSAALDCAPLELVCRPLSSRSGRPNSG